MEMINGRPWWTAAFDEHGTLSGQSPASLVAEIAASDVTNLFVVSHGWNNQVADARSLYQQFFPIIQAQASAAPSLAGIGFVGVFWPAIDFPDDPGTPVGPIGIGAQGADNVAPTPVNVTTQKSGAEITATMAPAFSPAEQEVLTKMGELIDQGLQQAAAGTPDAVQRDQVTQFHALLQGLMGQSDGALEDVGELALADSSQPVDDYQTLATVMSTGMAAGDAQGLGSIFAKAWNGAKDALRVFGFWKMKARAGEIGRAGLGPILEQLHAAKPEVRVHLIGHSFGGRLVANSLTTISSPAASPVASLTLVQGAFSHWAFSPANPFGIQGSLEQFADRVHGPLVATFTAADWAVGRWYPKACFLAGDDAQDAVAVSRWGAMGADGFQASTPFADITVVTGHPAYPFQAGAFHRADANAIISDTSQSAFAGAHSDFVKDEIGWLIAQAAQPIP
jgi:hypothetical protein